MSKVLMLRRTTGLQYDDRLRKEADSLHGIGHETTIVALEEANLRRVGKLGEADFETLRLTTVRIFPPGLGVFLKGIEFLPKCVFATLRHKPDTLWLHCHELFYLLPAAFFLRRLGVIRRIVWDQHELPPSRWMKSKVLGRLMSDAMRGVDRVIVANPWRRRLLSERLGIPEESIFVVDNRADRIFAELPPRPLPAPVAEWLNGSRYFVVQGGAVWRRNFNRLIAALARLPEAKIVVIGKYRPAEIKKFRQTYSWFNERVYLAGMVPQLEIPCYLDSAVASIILYQRCSDNNWLCAPNRLYQAAARGTPVLVGKNPPMAAFVEQSQSGIVLDDDGSDSVELSAKMRQMLEREAEFREHALRVRMKGLWEEQLSEFVETMKESGEATSTVRFDDRLAIPFNSQI